MDAAPPERRTSVRIAPAGRRHWPKPGGDAFSSPGDEVAGATPRGWAVGLACVLLLALVTPYIDFVIRATRLSFNSVPLPSFVVLLVLAVPGLCALRAFRGALRLGTRDLTLVFCMMFVSYSLSGFGFMMTWATSVSGSVYYGQDVQGVADKVHAHFTPGFFVPPDPPPDAPGPRPLKAFYEGLEPGQQIDWELWGGVFSRWALGLLLIHGVWFSLSALLRRRWSEQERLPFPLAQVPEHLIQGFSPGDGGGLRRWAAANAPFLLGAALILGLHTWNMLAILYNWIPDIPLEYRGLQEKYFTEPPWNNIGRLNLFIRPTMIGLAFLVSCEVSFSIWSIYWLQKVLLVAFGTTYGCDRMYTDFRFVGSGALFMLAGVSFWAARSELAGSLRDAFLPRRETQDSGDVSPRALWLGLLASAGGTVAWLSWLGISPLWAAFSVAVLVLMSTGLARLVGEAGAFAAGLPAFPLEAMSWVAPPALMGARSLTLLTMWDRVLAGDYYRVVAMPNIMNALHLARSTGLRVRTLLGGMAAALVLTLAACFFSFLITAHYKGGFGLLAGDWYGKTMPVLDAERARDRIKGLERYQDLLADAEAQGKTPAQMERRELPREAKVDGPTLRSLGLGAGLLLAFNVFRAHVLWWPHPAGLVLWMCLGVMHKIWFAFFAAWALKTGITKFGGMQVYRRVRPFFIGMIVGEAIAALVGIAVAFTTGHTLFEVWLT